MGYSTERFRRRAPGLTGRRRVRAIAHRGASEDRPENTLPAFDEALRQGADGIELDVQLSRDGIPLVYHDARLPGAGAGRRRLCELDHEAVRRLPGRLDSQAEERHIPSLEEVLVRYGHRTLLMIEIKALEDRPRHETLARAVVDLVLRTKTEHNVLILSFDHEVLEACRERAPSIRRVWNLDRRPFLGRRLGRRLPSLFGVGADVSRLSRSIASAVTDARKALLVYTCNTPAEVDSALQHGATFVLSDRPGWLRAYLEDKEGARHGA